MVKISVDTENDSPEMIAKIIDILNHSIGSAVPSRIIPSHLPVNKPKPVDMFAPSNHSTNQHPPSPNNNSFDMFNSSSSSGSNSSNQETNYSSQFNSASPLPSSAPVNQTSSMFDMFSPEPKPSQGQTSTTNPNLVPSPTRSSPATANPPAGFADNDLFSSFSSGLPSTNPSYGNNTFSSNSSSSSDSYNSNAQSFKSADSLLNDDFTVFDKQEDDDDFDEPKQQANFFNFEQY